ncbi:hypothetical protein LguiB_021339 [Lonicera macranthoides]
MIHLGPMHAFVMPFLLKAALHLQQRQQHSMGDEGTSFRDAATIPITVVNPPPLQEMNSVDNNPNSASSAKGNGRKTIEMQAL